MLRALVDKLRPRTVEEEMTSGSLRNRFRQVHDIDVGLYSYGCFDPDRIGRRVRVGRYCSFAPTSYVYTRNHGINFLSTTPFLYNRHLGAVAEDKIAHSEIVFEDDIWVGHNAVVLAGAGRIGRGAVIAAGAVVTRPVPAYSIVGGNPAQPLRRRFNEKTIMHIEALRWWEWDLETFRRRLAEDPRLFFEPDAYIGELKP